MGLAEMKVQKLVLGVQFFYNGYLSHQCKFPMLPLFKTSFKLTYFFSKFSFIISVLLFVKIIPRALASIGLH